MFDCTVPNNTLSRAELSYDEGTVLNVHYGDVLIKYGSVLDVQKDDIPRIPHRCREDFNGALLQDGDVIIADTAEDETTGKACEIGNLQGSAIVSGLHTMVCRPRNRMAVGYLGYYLNSNAYHHQLLPLMQGIKVLSLSRSNIQKTSVSYPIAVKEQQLIAYYFSQLDNLITLHQRKCANLCSPSQVVFSLLFVTSTFSWEQRKFGEITSKYEDPVPTPHDGYYRLGIRSHAKGTFHSYVAKGQELETAQMHRVAAGNFIVNITFGWEHAVAITDKNDAGKLVSHRFPQFSFAEGMVPEFFRYVIVDEKFRHHLWLASPGGAGRNRVLKLDEMLNYLMRFPSRDEQIKIAEFFRHLDNLITLHQRECISFTGRADRLILTANKKRTTSSWEQRKLGDIGKARSGVGFPDADQGGVTGVPFFKVSDMNLDGNENEMIVANNYVTAEQIADHRWSPITELPAIFFAKVGAAVMLNRKRLCRFPFLLDNNTMAYSLSPTKWDADFAKALFGTVDLTSLVQVGALPSYNAGDVESMGIYLPNLFEQEQIGAFFKLLDNLITLHQRQPFLHSTPDISLSVRLIYPFYTSSWEQRKVGDLLIERNQQAPMSDEYPLMAFIANEGVAPKGERYDRSALVTDTVNKLYKKTEKGDFIYSSNNLETGSIGLNKYGKACISPVYSIFEPTGIADSDFLGRRLVRKDFINAMVKWRQGVIYGQWRIHESDFLKIEITVPSVEEQRKIGTYLDQLDHLITLHQRKPFLMKWRTSDANRNQTNRLVL